MGAVEDLPVLMALRVSGRADPAKVARAVGCTEPDATAALATARARGAAAMGGDGSGFVLTAAGRDELADLLAAERLDRAGLAAVYERFRHLDADLKRAITTWQLAAAGDKRGATSDLAAAATAAGALATDLARIVARLAPYAGRLIAAAGAVSAGDSRFVASPHVDSLHQAWFELHEDLLATLGRSRET